MCDKECDKEYLQLASHHHYLLATSHSSLVCAIYGIMYHNSALWVIPAGVYVNSINYWRHPVKGIRRNLDICSTVIGLVINIFEARFSTNATPYYAITFVACLMYPLSYYFYWRKQYIIATFIHSMLHIFGNIGNLYLYSGEMVC